MSDRKSEKRDMHVLYKNLGETPSACILRFKKDNPEYKDEPMTYTGRLDPMAEGLLLVLSGEELQNKDKYLDLPKTYEFEVLWGFETDTLDVLGKVIKFESYKVESESKIRGTLKKSVGKFEQAYPAYSSKPVKGIPLFQWAREGRISEVEIPKHVVEVFDIKFVSRRDVSKENLLKEIISKINLVSGDFRQREIINRWEEVLSKTVFDTFEVDKISITVSSGFYVRQFVSDLAKALDTKAITFHIKRTEVGDYEL